LNTRYSTSSTEASRAGRSAGGGTSNGACLPARVRLARVIRFAIVGSAARNPRAIS